MQHSFARVSLALCTLTLPAVAQHTDTVLFGEADAAAKNAPAESQFVHPITSPYVHEDSFITSDLRAWYLMHEFTAGSPIGSGDATVLALQARVALTDRLQLVAYKDGYTEIDTPGLDDSGFNNIAAGLKWNFYRDWEAGTHASAGLGYELAVGDEEVLQDYDEWRLWISGNQAFDALHVGATFNYFVPGSSEGLFEPAERLSWHLHTDYRLSENFSPVLEINGYHTVDDEAGSAPFSGVDVGNIGGEGEDVITAGVGGEWRFSDRLAARLAYESPLTDNLDLFGYRWTFSLVWGF